MLSSPIRRALYAAGVMLPVLTVPLAAASPAWAALPGASSVLTRAPYLTDLTATSVQVNWATSAQYKGVVQYSTPGNCTANSVTASASGNPITINGVTEYQNTVTVTGLTAGTAFCYRITNTGTSPIDLLGANPSPQFTTLGGSGPLTFGVLGDWGDTTNSNSNTTGAVNVNQAGVDAQIASSGVQFVLAAGTSPTRAARRPATATSARPAPTSAPCSAPHTGQPPA